MLPLRDVGQHLRYADAAAAAGVKRFIPADYGSVDSRSPYARQLVKLFDNKVKVQREARGAVGAERGQLHLDKPRQRALLRLGSDERIPALLSRH